MNRKDLFRRVIAAQLTPAEIARRAGLDRSVVFNILRGSHPLTPALSQQILAALKAPSQRATLRKRKAAERRKKAVLAEFGPFIGMAIRQREERAAVMRRWAKAPPESPASALYAASQLIVSMWAASDMCLADVLKALAEGRDVMTGEKPPDETMH